MLSNQLNGGFYMQLLCPHVKTWQCNEEACSCIFFQNTPAPNTQFLMERKLPLFTTFCLPSIPQMHYNFPLIIPRFTDAEPEVHFDKELA